MTVVFDTNVLISALIHKGLCADLFEICLLEHHIAVSREILDELNQNLSRKFGVPIQTLREYNALLEIRGQMTVPETLPPEACRDQSDLAILGAAVSARAELIVTGDNDLLILKEFRGIKISSPRQLWNFFSAPRKRST